MGITKAKKSLTDLPADMVAVILGKVGKESHTDFRAAVVSCKTFKRVSIYPDVLKDLNLLESYPPPWNRIPENSDLLYECASYGNVHATFLCGLIDFYFKKHTIAGSIQLSKAAEASHPEAMYLYGMILVNQNRFTEGSMYLTKLWKEHGLMTVRKCMLNCKPVVLEISVKDYRNYDFLLAEMEVGDECLAGEYDVVCESCFIYKEIFRFIDYLG